MGQSRKDLGFSGMHYDVWLIDTVDLSRRHDPAFSKESP